MPSDAHADPRSGMLVRPPRVLPVPGPPPRPPVIPAAEMSAVGRAIEQLVDVADATRRIHEESVRTTTDVAHFEGATATTFRTQLVGQLRRLRALVIELEADLDVLATSRRAAVFLEEAHAVALRAHRAAEAAHRDSVDELRRWSLAQGHGPREPPGPDPASRWATGRPRR